MGSLCKILSFFFFFEDLTCATIIRTSHVVVHVWDEGSPGLVQLDVYTWVELDKQIIFDALEKWDPIDRLQIS